MTPVEILKKLQADFDTVVNEEDSKMAISQVAVEIFAKMEKLNEREKDNPEFTALFSKLHRDIMTIGFGIKPREALDDVDIMHRVVWDDDHQTRTMQIRWAPHGVEASALRAIVDLPMYHPLVGRLERLVRMQNDLWSLERQLVRDYAKDPEPEFYREVGLTNG